MPKAPNILGEHRLIFYGIRYNSEHIRFGREQKDKPLINRFTKGLKLVDTERDWARRQYSKFLDVYCMGGVHGGTSIMTLQEEVRETDADEEITAAASAVATIIPEHTSEETALTFLSDTDSIPILEYGNLDSDWHFSTVRDYSENRGNRANIISKCKLRALPEFFKRREKWIEETIDDEEIIEGSTSETMLRNSVDSPLIVEVGINDTITGPLVEHALHGTIQGFMMNSLDHVRQFNSKWNELIATLPETGHIPIKPFISLKGNSEEFLDFAEQDSELNEINSIVFTQNPILEEIQEIRSSIVNTVSTREHVEIRENRFVQRTQVVDTKITPVSKPRVSTSTFIPAALAEIENSGASRVEDAINIAFELDVDLEGDLDPETEGLLQALEVDIEEARQDDLKKYSSEPISESEPETKIENEEYTFTYAIIDVQGSARASAAGILEAAEKRNASVRTVIIQNRQQLEAMQKEGYANLVYVFPGGWHGLQDERIHELGLEGAVEAVLSGAHCVMECAGLLLSRGPNTKYDKVKHEGCKPGTEMGVFKGMRLKNNELIGSEKVVWRIRGSKQGSCRALEEKAFSNGPVVTLLDEKRFQVIARIDDGSRGNIDSKRTGDIVAFQRRNGEIEVHNPNFDFMRDYGPIQVGTSVHAETAWGHHLDEIINWNILRIAVSDAIKNHAVTAKNLA